VRAVPNLCERGDRWLLYWITRSDDLLLPRVQLVVYVRLGITIRRSKVDQVGAGMSTRLPWVDAAAVAEGALFRSVNRHGQLGSRLGGRDVARIVQRTAAASRLNQRSIRGTLCGLAWPPALHARASLNAPLWRKAAGSDAAWSTGYVRDAKLLDGQNPASGIGL
jgi:hypothetical protein